MAKQVCSLRKILGFVCHEKAGLVNYAFCTRIKRFLERLDEKIGKLNSVRIRIDDLDSRLCEGRIEAAI